MTKPCPRCPDGILTRRNGRNGPFYGCSNYFNADVKCRYTESIDEDEEGDDASSVPVSRPPSSPQLSTNAAIPTTATLETLKTAELLRLAAACLDVVDRRVHKLAKETADASPSPQKGRTKPPPPPPLFNPGIRSLDSVLAEIGDENDFYEDDGEAPF